jgi:hypothetical protein
VLLLRLLLSSVPSQASGRWSAQMEFLSRPRRGMWRSLTVPAEVELLTQASSALGVADSRYESTFRLKLQNSPPSGLIAIGKSWINTCI